ncbi:MAG TPA: hypothetical protein DCE41_34255 [Cytophagales bacterium]|nr:hypothetical protein [Cytophagales bacterium]HAA24114.1 hypothetical protein [Cytophagales bacterium]HAP62803.1 hypothetical protein [Cytophagales bacterium]
MSQRNIPLLIITIICLYSCQKTPKVKINETIATVEELKAHTQEFGKPEIVEVTAGVHMAIGFGLANSILLEGIDGNIIVDCSESNEVAARIKAEFDKISDKPIKSLIY